MENENYIRIPQRKKDEEKCPLPDNIHKICRETMGKDGWDCVRYCWRNLNSAIVTLGKRTFVVDNRVKEFDFQTQLKPQPELKKEPPRPAEKDPFAGW